MTSDRHRCRLRLGVYGGALRWSRVYEGNGVPHLHTGFLHGYARPNRVRIHGVKTYNIQSEPPLTPGVARAGAPQDSDDDTNSGGTGPAAPRPSRFPRPAPQAAEPIAQSTSPAPLSRTRAVEDPSPDTSADAAPTRLRRPNRFSAPESPDAAGPRRAEAGPLGAGAETREGMTAKERIAARMAARAAVAAGAEATAGAAEGGEGAGRAGAREAGGRGASVGRARLAGRARASAQDPEDDLL